MRARIDPASTPAPTAAAANQKLCNGVCILVSSGGRAG